MGIRAKAARVVLTVSLVGATGCDSWVSSSSPPNDPPTGPAQPEHDIVQPLSIAGPVESSGIDVRHAADQIVIHFDRSIDQATFCVDTVDDACCQVTLSGLQCPKGPSDVLVTNVSRGASVPLAFAQLVTPIAVSGPVPEDEVPEVDSDLPGSAQPLASILALVVAPSYSFLAGELVEVRLRSSIQEAAASEETMPADAFVRFLVQAEDTSPPTIVTDSVTTSDRFPPHGLLSMSFSEPLARVSVSIEPPIYGHPAGDLARFAVDGVTGGAFIPGRTQAIAFLPPTQNATLALDERYWIQVLSDDCLFDGMGACLFVPTQDASGSELLGSPASAAPTTWIRSILTAPVRISTPLGWPRLAERQEPVDPATRTVLGPAFRVSGDFRPQLRRTSVEPEQSVSAVKLFLKTGAAEYELGEAALDTAPAGAPDAPFALDVDLAVDLPESIAWLNGSPVLIEARAYSSLGFVGADSIRIGMDLLPPGAPTFSVPSPQTFRPDDSGTCSGILLEGVAQPDSGTVEILLRSAPTLPATVVGRAHLVGSTFSFSWTLSSAAGTGSAFANTFYARARDLAGNASPLSSGVSVFCESSDGRPVQPTIVDPADGYTAADRRIPISGSVSSGVRRVVVRAAGHETSIEISNSLSFASSMLAPVSGPFEIEFMAEDSAGDRSAPVKRQVSIEADALLAQVAGDGQVIDPGSTSSPLVVRATTEAGSAVSGVAVQFRIASGGGTFPNGQATIDVLTGTDGQAGTSVVVPSTSGVTVVEAQSTRAISPPRSFRITAIPPTAFQGPVGAPFELRVVGGQAQRGTVDSILQEPFSALLLDASGRAVPNTDVYFRVSSTTPLISSALAGWQSASPCPGTGALLACARTDARGIATNSIAFRLGQKIDPPTATAVLAKDGDAAGTLAQIVQIDACLDPASCGAPPDIPSVPIFVVTLPGEPAAMIDCNNPYVTQTVCGYAGEPGLPNHAAARPAEVMVRDSFENAIANIGITFSVGISTSSVVRTGAFAASGTNAPGLIDPALCPHAFPIITDGVAGCNVQSVIRPSGTFGTNFAGVFLGDRDNSFYVWRASAAGLVFSSERLALNLERVEHPAYYQGFSLSFPLINGTGAKLVEQEDPWSVIVSKTICRQDVATGECDCGGAADDDCFWDTERLSQNVTFGTVDQNGQWAQSQALSSLEGDLVNYFTLGPGSADLSQLLIDTQSAPGPFTPVVSEVKLAARLSVGAFSLEHVEPPSRSVDTFAEVHQLIAKVQYAPDSLRAGMAVGKPENLFVQLTELPGTAYYQGQQVAGDFRVSRFPPLDAPFDQAIAVAVGSGGLAKTLAKSVSPRNCTSLSCSRPFPSLIAARTFAVQSNGAPIELSDQATLASSAAEVRQWRDVLGPIGLQEEGPDGKIDWAAAVIDRAIRADGRPERERHILGWFAPNYRTEIDLGSLSGAYDSALDLVLFNASAAPARLNEERCAFESSGSIPDAFVVRNSLTSTVRHEFRHRWQTLILSLRCVTCKDNEQADSADQANDSDGDTVPELPLRPKLFGGATADEVYYDSMPPSRGALRDEFDLDDFKPLGPAGSQLIEQRREINAFDFATQLEDGALVTCTPN